MITISFSEKNFEYDVHSLVKAFYPYEQIKMIYMDDMSGKENDENAATGTSDDDGNGAANDLRLNITYHKADGVDRVYSSIEVSFEGVQPERVSEREELFEKSAIRGEQKNVLKRMVYRVLSRATNTNLPWGDLTGIRPTRLALKRLFDGESTENISRFMKETYYVSDEKTELSINIAKRELATLSKIDYKNGYSLYIGIPFCPTTCLYCSFASNPIISWNDRVLEYLDTVKKELEYTLGQFGGKMPETIYIGGGTPTSISADHLDVLLSMVTTMFDMKDVKEFTVEAGRPDSITRQKLSILKKYNVSRISINPQTMKEETLRLIGRRHTVEQFEQAYYLAREMGFDNINMDLILGLPGESVDDVASTLEKVGQMKPDSLTVHSLAVKRASRLMEWMKENGSDSINNTPQMVKLCENFARENNLLPYYLYRQKNIAGNFENVGYAKEGKFGLYNILIMEEVQTIVACGAGTVTKRVFSDGQTKRCDNHKDVDLYIKNIDELIERKRKLFAD